MGNFQISKTKFGLSYKIWPENHSDMQFPKEIKTAQQIKEFFRKGLHTNRPGNYDEPKITFVDPSYKNPVKFYTVRKDRKLATVDFEKTMLFDFRPEAYEFLKQYTSEEDIEQSEKIITIDDKINFLKLKASEETLAEFETLVASKNSDAGLEKACRDHAKQYYNMDAAIEFED